MYPYQKKPAYFSVSTPEFPSHRTQKCRSFTVYRWILFNINNPKVVFYPLRDFRRINWRNWSGYHNQTCPVVIFTWEVNKSRRLAIGRRLSKMPLGANEYSKNHFHRDGMSNCPILGNWLKNCLHIESISDSARVSKILAEGFSKTSEASWIKSAPLGRYAALVVLDYWTRNHRGLMHLYWGCNSFRWVSPILWSELAWLSYGKQAGEASYRFIIPDLTSLNMVIHTDSNSSPWRTFGQSISRLA